MTSPPISVSTPYLGYPLPPTTGHDTPPLDATTPHSSQPLPGTQPPTTSAITPAPTQQAHCPLPGPFPSHRGIRSNAQGNCSAKSLASNVINSSLSSLSLVTRGDWWGVGGGGGGLRGRGQGTFHPPCHVLHDHMALRPKMTSHNNPLVALHSNPL